MRKLIKIVAVVFIVLGMLAVGCAKAPPTPAKVIKIGCNAAVTGAGSEWSGIPMKQALEINIDEMNAAGGIKIGGQSYNFSYVMYDHKYNPVTAVEIVQRLITQDKVDFIFSAGGATTMPILPITTENKILTFSFTTGKKLASKTFPYNIIASTASTESAGAFYPWLVKNKPGCKKIAVINPDDESGYMAFDDSKTAIEKAGLTVIAKEYYKRGTTDFYPILTRVLAAKPDMIEMGTSPTSDTALAIKQARELGFTGLTANIVGTLSLPTLLEVGGAKNVEGLYLPHQMPSPSPEMTEYEKHIRDESVKRYGEPFNEMNWFYVYLPVLAQGIQKAKSLKTEDVIKALETMEFTARGRKTKLGGGSVYELPHLILMDQPITQVVNGQFKLLEMVALPPGY